MSGMLRPLTGAVWLGVTVAGMAGLWRYSLAPAPTRDAGMVWPEGSGLPRPTDRFQLVMFLHPECPCSRASLEELGVLMARCPGQFSPELVFFTPADKAAAWEDTALRRQAREMPGTVSRMDMDGTEARLFGAQSSGETFVYNSRAELVFHGGLTGARGHSGDNDGLGAVESLVKTGGGLPRPPGGSAASPVYGCSLRGAETVAIPAKSEAPGAG